MRIGFIDVIVRDYGQCKIKYDLPFSRRTVLAWVIPPKISGFKVEFSLHYAQAEFDDAMLNACMFKI
jgi:cytochrome c-type biogenesis protein CcmH/NrfF